MERFIVNGKEVEFDVFDLDVMDGYLSGTKNIDNERRVKQEGETSIETLRRACNAILDFFDDQLGEGAAEELFGQKINVKSIFDGYKEFVTQVNTCICDYSKTVHAAQPAPQPVNRAQRREEKRRRS